MSFPHAIPAFSDNYIWLIDGSTAAADSGTGRRQVIIVDPGDAAPVYRFLDAQNLEAAAIFVTHHHYDHIDGVAALCQRMDIPVYGPRDSRIPQLSHPVDDGDQIHVNGLDFCIIATPGHTLDHITYYTPGMLFSGDTLFAAGCGRLFEGSPAQMFTSLQRLDELPADTRVFCTHEYTLKNLQFAHDVEPDNADIRARLEQVQRLRQQGQITLPTVLAEERLTNPFLRCHEASVMAAASRFAGRTVTDAGETFKIIRFWKDSW
jgi:hydroxyacylglutathione hydrolase